MPGGELLTPLARLRATHPRDRDRGSVAVFSVVFAVAVIFLTALIVDGGNAMNARERAADIAGQAARAAAEDIAPAALRQGTAPGGAFPIDWTTACGYAQQVVQRYGATLNGTTVTVAACPAQASSPTQAAVTVQVSTKPLIGGGLLGYVHRDRDGDRHVQMRERSSTRSVLMAPPIPGLRKPAQVPTRTAGDVLVGILAIIALVALTVGVPIALVTVIGLPWPHAAPGLSVLTHQLDIPSILRVLSIVIWLAWLQLVWCVIVEIKAAVRNVGLPSQVPLAGATQSAAHRLVTAALLLFTAGAALSPAFVHGGPPRPSHTVSSVLPSARGAGPPGPQTAPPQPVQAPAVAQAPNAGKIYIVKPPEGRYHESLWEIAENHLGDGRRYAEIYEMNKDRVQPDGAQLTIASLIRPGWILRMPRDAYGPGIEAASRATAASAGQLSPSAGGALGGRASAGAQVPGAGLPGTGTPAPLATGGSATGGSAAAGPFTGDSAAGSSAAEAQPAAGPVRPGENDLAVRGSHTSDPLPYPYELSAASLLAAGLLAALGRRRREQLWRRAFGQRIAVPDGAAATAESALRIGADEPSVRLLDVGLRQLSQALASQDKALPTVFAAHIGADNLDLWVAPADPSPPEPWTAADGGAVWRLPLQAVTEAGLDGASGVLAPYPGLVSIGTNETGRILVDLEVAHGLVAVRGPHRPVQAALAALAVELATNRWSDQMRITLVGFGEELAMIAPGRVTAVATLDEALPQLQARATEIEQALAESGRDSVLTGRSRTADAQTWAPHYLIMAAPPTPTQRERLLTLARTRHRTALGFVIAGDIRGATWTWEVTEDGRLKADVLGFDLAAQLLPPDQYGAVVELFRAAQGDGVDLTDPSDDGAPAAQLVPGARMPVEIGLLGPVTIDAPGPVDGPRQAAVHRTGRLPRHPSGRGSPQRADRRDLAARGDRPRCGTRPWPGSRRGSAPTTWAAPT